MGSIWIYIALVGRRKSQLARRALDHFELLALARLLLIGSEQSRCNKLDDANDTSATDESYAIYISNVLIYRIQIQLARLFMGRRRRRRERIATFAH